MVPEYVIVPAHPALGDGPEGIVFETRETPSGETVLPVFSSVSHLVSTLGHAQPWLAMQLRRVRELAAAGGLREVVLDPAAEPGAWMWKFEDLETLEREENRR